MHHDLTDSILMREIKGKGKKQTMGAAIVGPCTFIVGKISFPMSFVCVLAGGLRI